MSRLNDVRSQLPAFTDCGGQIAGKCRTRFARFFSSIHLVEEPALIFQLWNPTRVEQRCSGGGPREHSRSEPIVVAAFLVFCSEVFLVSDVLAGDRIRTYENPELKRVTCE